MATKNFNAGFDFKRLPGNTSWGSNAFYRKTSTQDARAAMAGIISEYGRLINNFKTLTPDAVKRGLQPIFHQAQQYAPEDTGALWESGKLSVTTGAQGKVVGSITFGDETAWYAAIVHEFVWLHHEAPTRAKYLQTAMEEGLDMLLIDMSMIYAGILK